MAVGVLNDKSNLEGSGNAEWQHRTKPNNSFDASGFSMDVIVNLDAIRTFLPPRQFGR
jgi:hypothetical protein